MKIGFIGLGIMGKPMAKNLLKTGHTLYVYNRSREAVEELAQLGAVVSSPEQIGMECDVICTMLPDSPDVKGVILDQLYPFLHEDQTIIDMSSINPNASKEIGAALKKKHVYMLDAPVSGGEPKAIDGTLSFMVGGEKELFKKYESILRAMGSTVTYCGALGSGNTVKLANQVIVAANIAAVAEGLTLAKRNGVLPEIAYQAIRGGLAGSTVMDAKAPMMIENNTKPGFKIKLHIKDLKNALQAATQTGSPTPLSSLVMQMMQVVNADGFSEADHSALAKYYEKVCGDTIYNQ